MRRADWGCENSASKRIFRPTRWRVTGSVARNRPQLSTIGSIAMLGECGSCRTAPGWEWSGASVARWSADRAGEWLRPGDSRTPGGYFGADRVMLGLGPATHIYLAAGVTDLHKGFEGLRSCCVICSRQCSLRSGRGYTFLLSQVKKVPFRNSP